MAAENSRPPGKSATATAAEPPRRPAARARQGTLTRDAIIDAVITLIERDGVSAMSMRRLGEELGVDATAVYRHFRDKDDLILAAFDRVSAELAEQIRDLPPTIAWRERLQRLALGSWRLAEKYPAIFSLCFARITGGPAEREIVEFMLATLASTGLPPEQVVLHYRAFGDTTLSLCGAAAALAALDPALRDKDANAWSRIYGVLPREEYPAARAHAAELNAIADQEIYEHTVQALLDGIETAVATIAA